MPARRPTRRGRHPAAGRSHDDTGAADAGLMGALVAEGGDAEELAARGPGVLPAGDAVPLVVATAGAVERRRRLADRPPAVDAGDRARCST